MKRKTLLLLVVMLSLSLFTLPLASFGEGGAGVEVKPGDVKVFVGCDQVQIQAFNIDGYNYFKLRDLAQAITGSAKQFDVTWNAEKGRIDLLPKKAYTPVGGELSSSNADYTKCELSQAELYVNGYKIIVNAYTIDGNNYYKLRDIAGLFNIKLNWNAANKTILIDPSATGRPG